MTSHASTVPLEMQPPSCYNETMSAFTSFGIIIAAMLILGFLQLPSGILALQTHYALGKFSRKKAFSLALFFILGVGVLSICFFLSIYYLISVLLLNDQASFSQITLWVFASIFIALALFCLCFYYRRGKHSQLFIPRSLAKALDHDAASIQTRPNATRLGLISYSCEFFLTLPLYFIVSIALFRIKDLSLPSALLAILFVLTPTVPLFMIFLEYRSGFNFADILKNRVKSKPLIRILLGFCFSVIAALIIYSGVV